jgi:hypothetical protein
MIATRRFIAFVIFIFLSGQILAANRYWVSILGGNWNSTTSWSASSGGLPGASAPVAGDAAIFDGGSFLSLRVGKCTITAPVNAASIEIDAKYTGTIIQGANSITVSGTAALGGGNFTGGTANITVVGTFTLSATDFTSTSATLELNGDAAFTGGSFIHNSGRVKFNGAASQTISGTSPQFYILEFVGTGHAYTLSSAGNIGVVNSLALSGSSSYTLASGALDVSGDIALTNTSTSDGGTTTINITGSGNQAISSALLINQSTLPSINISKTGGTLKLPALITVMGNWSYTSGTLDVTTNNSTVVFDNSLNITGSHTLNNVLFEGVNNWTFTIASGTILTVNGDMAITGGNNVILNTGTINLNGNLNLTNTATGGGGNAIIAFTGSTDQAINSTLLINQSSLPAITVNKTGGTLTFPTLITVCGNWTYSAGTMVVTNSTIVFAKTLSISGINHSLNNVTFEGNNNWTFTFNTGTIMTVAGTLTTIGASNIFISNVTAGTTSIQAQGDVAINNTSTTGGGTAQILISGTGAQSFSSTVASGQGLLPFIKIQKASGTLTLGGTLSVTRDWTYVSGTVAPSSSTVVFGGNNLSISSAGMTFNNLNFTSANNTLTSSLSAIGNLGISGTAVLIAGSNSINLSGNWTDRATAGFTEGTGGINFSGSAVQIITTPGGENFNNVTLNNAAGIRLANAVAVAGGLTMTQGNIDLNGNSITLGSSATLPGILNYNSGTMINTGSFIRWFKTGVIAAGSSAGLFPVGTATDYRPVSISAPVSGPSAGGTIAVTYTNATTNSVVSFSDLPFTVSLRKDLNWATSMSGLTGGSYNLQVQGTHFGQIGAVSDLRLTLAGGVVGTARTNAGTTIDPQVNRTGLTAAGLGNTFYLASVNPVSTPLPVTLISFTASLLDQQVELRWETSSETQNEYFTVLRSADAESWDSVGRVDGNGNSETASYYQFLDPHPLAEQSYYRLKNTDFDGYNYLSRVCEISLPGKEEVITVYPNPASGMLEISSSGNLPFTVDILNAAGQEVESAGKHLSVITLNVSRLPTGLYFVHVTTDDSSETKTVIISR